MNHLKNLSDWLRQAAIEHESSARARRNSADCMRTATPASLSEGRKLAEAMGHSIPRMTTMEARDIAERDDHIATKLETKGANLRMWADYLDALIQNDELLVEQLCESAKKLLEEYARKQRVFQLDLADFRKVFTPIVATFRLTK